MKDNYILQEIERLEGIKDALFKSKDISPREVDLVLNRLHEVKLAASQAELTAKLIVEGMKLPVFKSENITPELLKELTKGGELKVVKE